MNKDLFHDLIVVGTTTPVQPDALPARLAPIYRTKDGSPCLLLKGDAPGEVTLDYVDEAWVREQVDDGDIALFGEPFAARAGHVLLQTAALEPPEYLPERDLGQRLRTLCAVALHDCAKAIQAGDRTLAEKHAFYASRADAADPLPLLTLRALLRGQIKPEHLAHLETYIDRFSDEARAVSLEAKPPELQPLIRLVQEDLIRLVREDEDRAAPRPRPKYITLCPGGSKFLQETRAIMAKAAA